VLRSQTRGEAAHSRDGSAKIFMTAQPSGIAFFDTNVLVYRHDRRGAKKREIANRLFRDYLRERRGVIRAS
jgi:hypothetical protein